MKATNWRRLFKWAGAVAALPATLAVLLGTALAYPQPFFAYHTVRGRLALYSDKPFKAVKAQGLLAEVDRRLARSPLDHHDGAHSIFVSNASWRRMLFMNTASGAAGVNFYPVTRNVFTRGADIDHDALIRPNGTPAEKPRTLTYYAAHEITHSLTAEKRGLAHLWNFGLPVWVREGYADYVGMGGKGPVDVAALYAQYRTHDRRFDPKSGYYARYRLLVAYFLDRRGWSVARLMDTQMSLDEAEREMNAGMRG
jgi:hypothetical protein